MRLRIAILPVLALAAVLSTLAVAGPAASVAQAKPVIGLADQNSPRCWTRATRRPRSSTCGSTVSYDQIRKGGEPAGRPGRVPEHRGHAQGKDVLVSFYRTASCSPACAARRLPSVSEFRTDFRAFRKRYP